MESESKEIAIVECISTNVSSFNSLIASTIMLVDLTSDKCKVVKKVIPGGRQGPRLDPVM